MECEAMSDMLVVLGSIILYGLVVYIIQVKILKLDPYKDPWEGDI
jgi:hypothetical protein